MNDLKIYAFTFLKNGVLNNYPFMESLNCLNELSEKVYVALGKGEDRTVDLIESLEKIEVISTIWDEQSVGNGGQVLSVQANLALSKLKGEVEIKDSWAIFLHADELFNDVDFEEIKIEIAQAEQNGHDSISYPFIHFWNDYNHVAYSSKKYQREIRAIKLDSNIFIFGDSEGVAGQSSVCQSNIPIYHYGEARDLEKRKNQKKYMLSLISEKDQQLKDYNIYLKSLKSTRLLAYRGVHPRSMKKKIEVSRSHWSFSLKQNLYILGSKSDISQNIVDQINVQNIVWCTSISEIPLSEYKNAINISTKFRFDILLRNYIPKQILEKFPRDLWFVFKLSQKGYSLVRR